MLNDNDSMFNTPPTFAWYLSGLVFKWLKQNGGVAQMIPGKRRWGVEHGVVIVQHSVIKNRRAGFMRFTQQIVTYDDDSQACSLVSLRPGL